MKAAAPRAAARPCRVRWHDSHERRWARTASAHRAAIPGRQRQPVDAAGIAAMGERGEIAARRRHGASRGDGVVCRTSAISS
jgi:hypothetical protein